MLYYIVTTTNIIIYPHVFQLPLTITPHKYPAYRSLSLSLPPFSFSPFPFHQQQDIL